MVDFLSLVKTIFADFNRPVAHSKPLEPRGLDAWLDARALTVEEAEALRGVWMGAQVGDLIFPTYSPGGEIVGARLWAQEGKRLAPRADSGLATTGAVLANAAGRAILEWGSSYSAIIFAEGEPDFVTACLFVQENGAKYGTNIAVFGIYSGAWVPAFGARIGAVCPDASAFIATDRDGAGERYAGQIRASLPVLKVYRSQLVQGKDLNDLWRDGALKPTSTEALNGQAMPQPPSMDEGRWGWSDAEGWSELPSWAAAREAEKAWAAARAIPREALDDALHERAKKWCEAKLEAVCAELAQLDGNRARALAIMAPVMSLVAGGALDLVTVSGELSAAYVSGDKDTRKDRAQQIKDSLKSGPGGRPRDPVSLEDVAARLAADDAEEKRRAEAIEAERKAARATEREARKKTSTAGQEGVKIEAGDGGAMATTERAQDAKEWQAEIDALPWARSPSEMELANRLIEYLTPPGMPAPVAAEGGLWRYSPSRGLWVGVNVCDIARILERWDGAYTEDGKKVRIGKKAAENALGVTLYLADDPDFFKNPPRGIMLKDRFVTVDAVNRTVKEEAPGPQHRARHKVDATPSPMGELLTQYLATAHEGDDAPEKVQLMGEVAFVALAGLGTVYKKAILCHGGRGSGKSQFLHIVQSLVPASAKTTIMPQDMGHDYHCAALAGKTLNMVGELEAEDFMREGKFKSIVHGEAVQARNPSEKVFQLWPIALHLINANTLPSAPGVSQAFWDRWLVVGFEKGWTDNDRALLAGGVDDIGKRITDTDMGGILSWVLDCGRALVERGKYTIPATSRELMRQWQTEADTVATWLDERCEQLAATARRDQWEGSDPAYKDYAMYCEDGGHRPVNIKKFKDRLAALGVRRTRAGRGWAWAIRLTIRM